MSRLILPMDCCSSYMNLEELNVGGENVAFLISCAVICIGY
jgi:hypothetical protein